jgi:2'-5' RNA ligase
MRLFIAIGFTPAFRQAVWQTAQDLHRQLGAGQLTPPENLHVTLAFLGETDRLPEIRQAMSDIQAPPLTLSLQNIGAFSQKGQALYWVGLEKNPALEELAQTLENQLRQRGFALPSRAFSPHITLIRRAPLDQKPQVSVPAAHMTANRISLMRSERKNGRMVYTEIFKHPLGG